jgi:hypothetical protein
MAFRRTRCPFCKGKLAEGQRIHDECIPGFVSAQAEKAERARAKAARMAARVERAETRRRKEAIKRIPDLLKEAQREFNCFIRRRDQLAGYPCISSGRPLDWSGNGVDAGHYRSVGAAPHLRFDERNCHAQTKYENQYRAGNAVEYRLGLIRRIGLEAVESLEADNRVHRWTREELIGIRDTYRQKLKELKKETA